MTGGRGLPRTPAVPGWILKGKERFSSWVRRLRAGCAVQREKHVQWVSVRKNTHAGEAWSSLWLLGCEEWGSGGETRDIGV